MNQHPRSLREALRYGVENRNIRILGRTIDLMRFTLKMSYHDCYQAAYQLTGISEADWDELLYEVDQTE